MNKANLEITKMLTISTAHITEETAVMLEREVKYGVDNIPLAIYNKAEFGWIIFVSEYYKDLNMPEDLMSCLDLAKENNCEWLCLDCDGLIVPDLQTYDW